MKLFLLGLAALLLGAHCHLALVIVAGAALGWMLWVGAQERRDEGRGDT